MLVAQNSLGSVCPVPLTVRGTYSEGKVTGWLSAAESDFLDDTGQPAALFHVKYTKGELAGDQEDLELHEVKASIKIPDDSSDDFDDDASAMSWES